jgi:hypothetical protein
MNTNKYLYVKVKIINLREHNGSSPFFVGSVLLIFVAFCFVFFALFVVVLCDYCVHNVASVSGLSIFDSPFVFPNAMHWFSVHLSSIIVVCRKLECFNLLQPTRHDVYGTWSMWDAQKKILLMVADECMARLKDPIHFSKCLCMTGVSLGSYILKPFSTITTSSRHGIVMKMLSVICQSLSPPLQLVVTI